MSGTILAERIKHVRGSLTQAEFADKTGLSRQSVNNYEAGRTLPSAPALQRIAGAAGVTVSWLLGSGEERPDNAFFMPPADTSMPPIPILSTAQAGDLGPEPLEISRLPVEYQDALERSDQYWEGDGEYWLTRPADVKSINAYSVRVEGDSMLPMIKPGDFVIASPDKRVFSGALAVVKVRENAALVKVVQIQSGKLVLQSHNAKYQDVEFPDSKIEFCHKVVWLKVT